MGDLDDQLRQQTLTDDQCRRRDWSELADHGVLRLIARDHLPAAVDRIAASKVCRSWRRTILSVHDGKDDHRLCNYGLPCLVYVHTRESTASPSCRLLDPIHRDNEHTFDDVTAGDAGVSSSTSCKILFSRDGWLLMMLSPRTTPTNLEDEEPNTLYNDLFFLNLLSKSRIELPTLKTKTVHVQFSFSDRPTSPSCIVVVFLQLLVHDLFVFFCRPGDTQWTLVDTQSDVPFWGCSTNIACSSGRFYCLDKKGNLGGFDPSRQSWTFVERQEDLGSRVNGQLQQYLVESGAGELLRVCDMGNSVVLVYRFDAPTGRWVPVRDLGDRTLFVGRLNSMCAVAPVESMRGRVYFNAIVLDDRGGNDHVVVSCSIHQPEGAGEEEESAGKGRRNKVVVVVPPPAGSSERKWKKFMFSAWVDLQY